MCILHQQFVNFSIKTYEVFKTVMTYLHWSICKIIQILYHVTVATVLIEFEFIGINVIAVI